MSNLLSLLCLSLHTHTHIHSFLSLCRWYHGILSKGEAETVLRAREEGSYLVRVGGDGEYSLAIKSAKGFIHMRLRSRGSGQEEAATGLRLGEAERQFNTVVEMVKHYSLNRSERMSIYNMYRVDCIIPQICTASAEVNLKHVLKQMQYRFAVIYGTLSI